MSISQLNTRQVISKILSEQITWQTRGKVLSDPCESEIRTPRQLTIALKLSCYLFIIAKLFKVKDGCLKFVYDIKIPGLRRFWTVKSTPG